MLGRPRNAKKAFQEVIKQRGEHFGAYVHLGRLALEEGNFPVAQKELSAAQRTNPKRFARLEDQLTASLKSLEHRLEPEQSPPTPQRRAQASGQSKHPWTDPVTHLRSYWFSGWFAEVAQSGSAAPQAEAEQEVPAEGTRDDEEMPAEEFLPDMLEEDCSLSHVDMGADGLEGPQDHEPDGDFVEIESLDADEFDWDEGPEAISFEELPQISSPWGETRGLDEEDSDASTEAPLQNFYRELARGALPDETPLDGDDLHWDGSDDAPDEAADTHAKEHEKFAALPPIVGEEIARVNWDELAFRLNHWDAD